MLEAKLFKSLQFLITVDSTMTIPYFFLNTKFRADDVITVLNKTSPTLTVPLKLLDQYVTLSHVTELRM